MNGIEKDRMVRRQSEVCENDKRVLHLDVRVGEPGMWYGMCDLNGQNFTKVLKDLADELFGMFLHKIVYIDL